jgi:solute carrier family 24 (sodium/potassium/calcium exchanger), member 6
MQNCPDEEAGLISYLRLYYCSLADAKPIAFLFLVLWVGLLFSTIGIAASDFLCINLSTMANILGMSESLTGVTFLAFGNGSPDVFSTFAAMRSNSGSLAVGELVGAASFISAVVAGSMALVAPFQVARRSFIRDVGFFVVAASFSLVFLADGSLRLWECITMIAYYVFYVIFVVSWHWWLTRRRKQRLAETAARLQHHIPDTQELEVPEFEEDEESRPASERTGLLRAHSNDTVPTLLTPGTPAWKVGNLDDDDEARDRYLAELQSKMRVSRPSRGERRNTMTPIRPSLIGALEFRSLMTSLERKATNAQPIGLRRYSDDASSSHTPIPVSAPPNASYPDLSTSQRSEGEADSPRRMRAVSANDATHLRLDTGFLSERSIERVPETDISSEDPSPHPLPKRHTRPSANILRTLNEPSERRPSSPTLLVSPSGSQHAESGSLRSEPPRSADLLAPPPTSFHRPDYQDEHHRSGSRSPLLSPHAGPTLQVPILHTPHPDHSKGVLRTEDFPPYVDSPMVLTPVGSRPPSIRLGAPSISPESTHLDLLPDEEEEPLKRFSWWPYQYLVPPQVIYSTLFPTLYGWRDKSQLDRILGLITAPSVFLLTITLPVVEPKEDKLPDPDPALLDPGAGRRSRTNSQAHVSAATLPKSASPHPHGTGISRQGTDFSKTPRPDVDEIKGPKEWNRWLVFLQSFTAPFFVVTLAWANMDDDLETTLYVKLVLGSLVFSLVLLLVLLSLTSPDHEPKYRPVLCFLGFAVAIGWISTIANEVVGVLKAFGVILGMSDAILGLTIFAVGNSCGDLVADITVAKLGYPVMALSACFGGPMLNILLGIGIGGVYMTVHRASSKHAKHPSKPIKYKPYEIEVSTTLMISGITLLVTLVGLLIVVPLNGWRMDRKIGLGLILLWSVSTVGNVIVEMLGYGGTSF